MKNVVAKLLILIVVSAGVAGSASANARTRKFEVNYKDKSQSLMDFPDLNRKWNEVKDILIFLGSSLMPPTDIDIDNSDQKGGDSETKRY